MKNILLLLTLVALPACAGEPFSAPEEEPISPEPLVDTGPPQLLLLHRCEQDACEVAARRMDVPLALCADGEARPECEVRSILWPGPSDVLVPLAFLPAHQERLAVQGRWSSSGELEVLSAAVRVGEGVLPASWGRASPRACAAEGCAPLWIAPFSGSRGWSESWLDPSHAPGDSVAKNLALVQAQEPGGLLIAGARKGSGARKRLVLQDYFLRYSFAPSLCGEELATSIQTSSSGLLWPSETDAPITPWSAAVDGENSDEAVLRAALSLGQGTEIEASSGVDTLARLGLDSAGMSAEERASAARFRGLRAVLEANLSGLTTFRVGRVSVRIFIVGRSRCGELVGIETLAVET